MIPLTSGKEFEEAAQNFGNVIHENLKATGALPKRQTKRLNRILIDIRSEVHAGMDPKGGSRDVVQKA